MLLLPRRLAVLAVLLSLPFAGPARAAQRLSASDEILLQRLFEEFLFDPRGTERVSVTAAVRTVRADFEIRDRGGWLVRGKDGEPDRVWFTDGEWTFVDPSYMEVTPVDFRAACATDLRHLWSEKGNVARRKLSDGVLLGRDGAKLVQAAWLYRLGDEHLAAVALAESRRRGGDPVKQLRGELAWWAFGSMVHAYMVRADEEALSHGERLLRLYPDKAAQMSQAGQIVEELRRRQGQANQDRPARPDGFDAWEPKRKIAWLIDALDEVAVLQDGSPGGADLASDPDLLELIRLGDAAVPDLLDTLEKDGRLTRSVHYWRDYDQGRTVLSVREAALTALMSILRIQAWEAVATGDSFTSQGEEAGRKMAERLRAYWEANRSIPLDERMMRTLTDPEAGFQARKEAAKNLARLGEEGNLRTTIEPTVIGPRPERQPNPAIAKFSGPTVAEAILAAMDSELAASPAGDREWIASPYRTALVELGDPRIAPEAARRAAAAETLGERRKWAKAAHFLGEPRPFRDFAEDFRTGRIAVDPASVSGLGQVIGDLVDVGSPEASRALDTLAEPGSPYAGAVVRRLLVLSDLDFERHAWFGHSYCLRILRRMLDDATPTGTVHTLEGDRFSRVIPSASSSSGGAPDYLAALDSPRKEVRERKLDAAALHLAHLLFGAPRYHVLLPDADERLAVLKAALDRYAGSFRRASPWEGQVLGARPYDPHYLPGILPLGRAATAADVAEGRAVFHLDGRGLPVAGLELPAAATLKSGLPALVVQAEAGPDGQVTYGVITREAVLAVPASEVEIVS